MYHDDVTFIFHFNLKATLERLLLQLILVLVKTKPGMACNSQIALEVMSLVFWGKKQRMKENVQKLQN
jgi:hypothetical protein